MSSAPAYLDKAYMESATDELDMIYNPPVPEEERSAEEVALTICNKDAEAISHFLEGGQRTADLF